GVTTGDMVALLSKDGEVTCYRYASADRSVPASGSRVGIKTAVKRLKDRTIYELAIPQKELPQIVISPGEMFDVNLTVHEEDSPGPRSRDQARMIRLSNAGITLQP
ncbi:MAG: hypothetical protein PHT33_11890, partial [bacterium]|nr:hypothetical protein [bacterium]